MPGINNNYDHSHSKGFKMEEIVYIRGDSKKIRIVTGTRRFKFKDLICEVCSQKMEVKEDRCNYRLMHCLYCDDYKVQVGEEQII